MSKLYNDRYSRNDVSGLKQEAGTLPPISLTNRIKAFGSVSNLFNTIGDNLYETQERKQEEEKCKLFFIYFYLFI